MPRNASGVYTLPSGNPVVPGTTIDAAWANDTMEDMANEITNSLSRTGAGGMLAPFRLADGTVTAPGVAWLNETNSGLYRSGAGSTWVSILGVNTVQFSTVGVTIPFGKALTAQGNASVSGTFGVTGATTLGSTLAVTGAITATGGVVGNVTGNVTAGSGSSTFNDVTITGSLDMTAGSSATITGLSNPTNASDAANKGYVDAQDALRLALTGGTMSGSINMGGYGIAGLATPSADTDAATKAYVDSVAQGLDVKGSCRAATTGNITLSGTQTIDGVAVVAGDRVLVKDQSTSSQNGIYVAAAGAWSRASDADTWAELVGAFTFVEDGTVNDNSGWVCTVAPGGTLGTTAVTWEQFSGAGQINAGTGMTKTGNTLNVNTASSSRIVVGADEIDLATTGVTAGTYKSVTVDQWGRVTGGTNPTTLAGYGITDAYTKAQVDAADALKLNLTGGTMSGAIAMGANKITGLGDPTNPQDAATKNYIDTIFGSTTSAAASAAAAASSAASAATSATNAPTSASNAATSATNAATSYTTFNNQYLGSKTSDPATNNTGGALVAGNLYWNSTASEMRVYNGSAWVAAYLPGATYLALTGGTMTGVITFASAQTFDGAKVSGNISGNAATATYATSAGSASTATTATNVSGGTASVTTLTASSTVTLSGGTANGVAYLNGSKVLTTGSALTFDGAGNFYVKNTGSAQVTIQSTSAGSAYFQLVPLGGGTGVIYTAAGQLDIKTGDASAMTFGINSSEQMRLTSTGLGIGTSSPAAQLQVGPNTGTMPSNTLLALRGSSTPPMRFFGTDGNADYGSYFKSYYSGGQLFVIGTRNGAVDTDGITLKDGNVGIGTSSPSFKLDVSVTDTTAYSTSAYSYEPVRITNQGAGGVSGILFQALSTGTANTAQATISVIAESASSKNTALTFGTRENAGGTLPERMRLDSSGNLGLGVTPSAWISTFKAIQVGNGASFQGQTNSVSVVHVSGNAYVDSGGTYRYIGTGEAAQRYQQYLGAHSWYNAPSGTAGNAITFTQAMTLDASGNLLVGTTSGAGASERLSVLQNNNNWMTTFRNSHVSAPYGLQIWYTGSDPNDTAKEFLGCYGGGTQILRMSIRSNGGIANYSANNVNLSDRREKTNFAPAGEYLSKICAIPVQTFNYIDQNMEDDPGLTLGVVAQDVQAVAPELVMESNWAKEGEEPKMRLSIYQTDLQYALMKCIQEQQAIIEQLKADVAALKGA